MVTNSLPIQPTGPCDGIFLILEWKLEQKSPALNMTQADKQTNKPLGTFYKSNGKKKLKNRCHQDQIECIINGNNLTNYIEKAL